MSQSSPLKEDTLFEFPCQFPIKAMGKTNLEFDLLVLEIVRRHSSVVDCQDIKSRTSKDGNYVSVTVVIEATSKKQLDAIYQELTDHPLVLMTL